VRSREAIRVGRFNVECELANFGDMELARRGFLSQKQVRRETIQGVVDSGAAMLVLPQDVVKRLGLPLGRTINVRYADGRRAPRREVKGVSLTLLGRDDTFSAIVESKRQTALVGAIVLEALDLLVDCKTKRLVPRDPSGPLYEIE
jgi:predicted aspartyl protease